MGLLLLLSPPVLTLLVPVPSMASLQSMLLGSMPVGVVLVNLCLLMDGSGFANNAGFGADWSQLFF